VLLLLFLNFGGFVIFLWPGMLAFFLCPYLVAYFKEEDFEKTGYKVSLVANIFNIILLAGSHISLTYYSDGAGGLATGYFLIFGVLPLFYLFNLISTISIYLALKKKSDSSRLDSNIEKDTGQKISAPIIFVAFLIGIFSISFSNTFISYLQGMLKHGSIYSSNVNIKEAFAISGLIEIMSFGIISIIMLVTLIWFFKGKKWAYMTEMFLSLFTILPIIVGNMVLISHGFEGEWILLLLNPYNYIFLYLVIYINISNSAKNFFSN
jgi:uncharacterized membrane protein